MHNQHVVETLQFISEGGWVQRFHTRPGLTANTDAHHSHGVAMICALVWKLRYGTLPRAEILMAALTHDLGEQVASDVSSPAKRLLGLGEKLREIEHAQLTRYGLCYEKSITEEERILLGFADIVDGMLYCAREVGMGNKFMQLVCDRYEAYLIANLAMYDEPMIIIAKAASSIYREYANGPLYDVFA